VGAPLLSAAVSDAEDSFGASELARALEDGQLSSSDSEGERWDRAANAEEDTALSLVAEGLTAVPSNLAAGLPALRRLCLHGNVITALAGLSGLSALQDLNLSSNRIAELPPGALSGLSQLTALNLACNRLAHLAPTALAGLPRLRSLSLAHNSLPSLVALAALHGGPLQRLDIRGNALASLAEFSVLAGLPRLAELLVTGGTPGTQGGTRSPLPSPQ
jgi:Leucine-rich repeat (LRR) protein